MQQPKIRPFVCLAVLIFATIVACSTSIPTETQQPASQKPASFEVGPITFEPPVVMVGDTVTVTATVSNIGDTTGTYIAALSVDGQEVDTKAISVNPESSQQVSFQLSRTTAGSYNLAIGNSSATVTVYEWQPYTIRYDESEGSMVGIYVSGDNGHIVRFTPPAKPFRIQKIWVRATVRFMFTSDLDTNYCTVRIWDKDGNNQLWSQDIPWRIFGGTIEVPDIRVDDDFLVEVVTHSTPSVFIPETEIPKPGGDPIGFIDLGAPFGTTRGGTIGPLRVVLIFFDYPQSYISSPSNRPETRSGYSYMGKLIDPGQGRLKGIQWLIRVEGEGAAGY